MIRLARGTEDMVYAGVETAEDSFRMRWDR